MHRAVGVLCARLGASRHGAGGPRHRAGGRGASAARSPRERHADRALRTARIRRPPESRLRSVKRADLKLIQGALRGRRAVGLAGPRVVRHAGSNAGPRPVRLRRCHALLVALNAARPSAIVRCDGWCAAPPSGFLLKPEAAARSRLASTNVPPSSKTDTSGRVRRAIRVARRSPSSPCHAHRGGQICVAGRRAWPSTAQVTVPWRGFDAAHVRLGSWWAPTGGDRTRWSPVR